MDGEEEAGVQREVIPSQTSGRGLMYRPVAGEVYGGQASMIWHRHVTIRSPGR